MELSAGGASWLALHLLACLLACVKGHFARLFSSLFLGIFACYIIKPVFSVAMSSRQTNNSRSVSLFSDTSQVPVSTSADASSHSSTASTSSPAAAIFPATNVPDPAFLAAVVNAVKIALAAEKTPPSSDSATVPVSVPDPSCSSSLRVSGDVPSQRIWALVRRPFFPRVLVFLHHKQLRLLLLPQVGIIMLFRPSFLPSRTLPPPL